MVPQDYWMEERILHHKARLSKQLLTAPLPTTMLTKCPPKNPLQLRLYKPSPKKGKPRRSGTKVCQPQCQTATQTTLCSERPRSAFPWMPRRMEGWPSFNQGHEGSDTHLGKTVPGGSQESPSLLRRSVRTMGH